MWGGSSGGQSAGLNSATASLSGFSLVAQLVKNPPAMWETWVWSLVGKIPWRRDRLPTLVFWPGEFHGLYSPWGHKVSDTTEWLTFRVVVNYPCPAAPPRTEWPLLLCAEAVVTQWHTPLYRFPTFPAWFISPTHSCCPEIAWSTSPHAQQSVSTSVTDSCSAS